MILEMSGAPEATGQGLAVLRTGGQYVLVGAVKPIGSIPVDIEQVVRRMWTIRGVHNYSPADLITAVDFLAKNCQHFPFSELIAAVYSLDETNAAFQRMTETGAIRVAVRRGPAGPPEGHAV